jgi:septal ring factor EnvC (AmiA/AmiB activator)
MSRESLQDQLRQIERQVVQGERQLAEQEARLFELKRSGEDTTAAEAQLENLRNEQRRRDHDRQRILSDLQP